MKPPKSGLRPLAIALVPCLLIQMGCDRAQEQKSGSTPVTSAAVPAEPPAPVSLTPEQAARLVRAHSPVLGSSKAHVTIVEFLDPACSACAAFSAVVKQILFVHPDDVRVVVRFAAFHEGSEEAIRLLEAARRQGKFEDMLTALFDRQAEWATHQGPDMKVAWRIAAEIGVNVQRARKDAHSAAADELLRVDNDDVNALAVDSTPTFYVNAKPLPSFGPKPLMDMVASEVALGKSK